MSTVLLSLHPAGRREAALEVGSLVKTRQPKLEVHRYPPQTDAHFRRLFAVVREYLDAIRSGRFSFRPGWSCGMCEWRDIHCREWGRQAPSGPSLPIVELPQPMRNTFHMPKTPNAPNARHKLNAAYIAGAMILAGALGLLTRSPMVFVLTAGALIAASVHCGDIRLNGRR